MRASAFAAALGLALAPMMFGSGCATLYITVNEWPRPGLYPGTRSDWNCIRAEADKNSLGDITPFFGSMDLLFSMVADTVLLPLHACLRLAYGSGDATSSKDDPRSPSET